MRSLLISAFLILAAHAPASAQAPASGAPVRLDKGELDPAWFRLPASAFTRHDLADFGWEKPGFKVGGRSVRVVWEAPVWTDPAMDEDNLKAAEAHQINCPAYLREALSTEAGVTPAPEGGELLLVGRLVDCNAKGSFFSYSIETIVWDLKLVDSASGETLVALHNRLLGGAGHKGNGSRKRFLAWSKDFARYAKHSWMP